MTIEMKKEPKFVTTSLEGHVFLDKTGERIPKEKLEARKRAKLVPVQGNPFKAGSDGK